MKVGTISDGKWIISEDCLKKNEDKQTERTKEDLIVGNKII